MNKTGVCCRGERPSPFNVSSMAGYIAASPSPPFFFVHRPRTGVYSVEARPPCGGCGKSAGLVIERLRVRILAGAAGDFSSPVLTLCADSYSVSALPPVLPRWRVKDTGHSAKSAGNRLHLKTHTPLTQPSLSGLIKPLSRHSVKTYQETNSHAVCQETFGHTRPSSLSHCELILA